jgi:predicted MFS family arabinose efflux permease
MALALVPLVFIRAATRGGTTLQKSAGLAGLAENLKSPPVVVLLLVNVLFYSGYTVLFYFLRDFGRAAGIGNPGFFFTLAMIIMILIRAVGSRYFDRANKAYVSAACLVMLAIAHLLFRFAGTEWVFMTLSVVFGVLWGVGIPVIMALVFDVSEARFRGLNMNLCLVAMQVGFFVGPLIGGIILARWGYGTLFLFCGILNMTGAALFVVMPRAGGR